MADLYAWLWPQGLADSSARFVVDLALKSTLVLVTAAMVQVLLRRAAAARREMVWRAALVALLVLPALGLLLPTWRVRALYVEVPATETEAATLGLRAAPGGVDDEINAATDTEHTPAAPERAGDTVSMRCTSAPSRTPPWLLLAWLSGALATALPLALALVRVGRITGSAELVHAESLPPGVRVFYSDAIAVPMAAIRFPLRGATVLLPEHAREWTSERTSVVFEHELAHISRGDGFARLLGRLATSLCWFQPLAWWALRRMTHEAELACDDMVVAGGRRASDYAAHLLDMAMSARPSRVPETAVAMAHGRGMKSRLEALLDETRPRDGLTRGRRAMAIACVLLLAGPASMLRGSVLFGLQEEAEESPARVAAARGLAWLAQCQHESGGWAQDIGYKFSTTYQVTASARPHVGVTALVLEAFLRAGHLPERGAHKAVVKRAVDFLLASVEPKSGFINAHGSRMQSHSLALLTLLDVAQRTQDAELLGQLQPAVDLLVRHQLNGWRYLPLSTEPDLLNTAVSLRALRRARAAGMEVPQENIRLAEKTIGSMMRKADTGRVLPGFAYEPREKARITWGCTAEGLEAYVDSERADPAFIAACSEALASYRKADLATSLYHPGHYLFWHALHEDARVRARLARDGGKAAVAWRRCQTENQELLVGLQAPDGSWSCDVGPGAAYATAVACNILLME